MIFLFVRTRLDDSFSSYKESFAGEDIYINFLILVAYGSDRITSRLEIKCGGQMKRKNLSREELFALVWEKPAREVAVELGFSDVALGKLCRTMQVPKPPRGYWAKIRNGQNPRRPPLMAFREELEAKRRKQKQKRYVAHLSKLQIEFFKRALAELSGHEVDVTEVDLDYAGVRSLSSMLAAQVLILVQNRFEKWIDEETRTVQGRQGAVQSIRNLTTKLLPIARPQILIFEEEKDINLQHGNLRSVFVRMSPDLQHKISQMSRLAKEKELSYMAMDLGNSDGVLSVNYLHSPGSFVALGIELCVSRYTAWVRCKQETSWHNDTFETNRIPLQHMLPDGLLDNVEVQLPPVVRKPRYAPYEDRLRALEEADEIFDKLTSDFFAVEQSVPNERLSILDRLMYGSQGDSPFQEARRSWRSFEKELDKWEEILESERVELTEDILGVKQGD